MKGIWPRQGKMEVFEPTRGGTLPAGMQTPCDHLGSYWEPVPYAVGLTPADSLRICPELPRPQRIFTSYIIIGMAQAKSSNNSLN
jgi:hypothetical protein